MAMGNEAVIASLYDLSGNVALITGGGRWLGLEMARAFAQGGADLFLASRKLENCEAAVEEVEALGRRAVAYRCNAGVWQELDAMVDAAHAAFGRVDILVNNAGSSPVAPSSLETSEALYDKVMAVNLKGVFRTCAVVGTRMAAGEDRKSTRLNSSH